MVLVKGADPGSFCAEACGMLPTLCYLVRLAKFTGYFDTWMGVVATDNFTLLDAKLFKPASTAQHISILACNEHIPKDLGIIDVQSPEWDLVSNILTVLQKLPGAYLQFVPGHQDRKVAYAKLPFLAPLNVDANAMATWYQQQHPHIHTKVLLTNTAGIHLHMPQGSITSRYASAICYQATYGPLMAHIQKNHAWSSHTTKTINWKAHGSALRARVNKRTHFVKLVHGRILPTAKQLHQHDAIRRLCPACLQATEDWWTHILKCTHESRAQWQVGFPEHLRKECGTPQTCPLLTTVPLDAIQGWWECEHDTFTMDSSSYPEALCHLINQQNAIGWAQVMFGSFI